MEECCRMCRKLLVSSESTFCPAGSEWQRSALHQALSTLTLYCSLWCDNVCVCVGVAGLHVTKLSAAAAVCWFDSKSLSSFHTSNFLFSICVAASDISLLCVFSSELSCTYLAIMTAYITMFAQSCGWHLSESTRTEHRSGSGSKLICSLRVGVITACNPPSGFCLSVAA